MKHLAKLAVFLALPLLLGCPRRAAPPTRAPSAPSPAKAETAPPPTPSPQEEPVKEPTEQPPETGMTAKEVAPDAVQDNAAILKALMTKGDKTFGDADLLAAEKAFETYRADPTKANFKGVLDAMRANYVSDSEMGAQPQYFGRYADMVTKQVEANPGLKETGLTMYLNYLATDLQDAEVPALAVKGKKLEAVLGESEADMRKRLLGE